LFLGERAAEYFCHTNPSIIRKFEAAALAARSPNSRPIRVPFPSDVPQPLHMGLSSPNHTLSGTRRCRSPSPHPSRRLLAGGAPLLWFTVGLKHDEIHVTEARSCNQEEDDFWRQPENTDLLGPRDCGRIIRGKLGPLSGRWSRRVCKLLNSNCDPTPDSRTSVIAVCRKLRRTSAETRPSGEAPQHAGRYSLWPRRRIG
jgi:hypothetical protein